MDTCVALTDLQAESCRLYTQYNLVGPITNKPKHLESSCFPLFILCTRFIKFFVLCWCVHIAYVSIRCPVDIVVLNLDFSDLCRFYITCGLGRGVVCLLQRVLKAVNHEAHSSLSWHSSRFKNAYVQFKR